MIRLIPSLLLCDGKLIKGKKFSNHTNVGRPEKTLKALEDQGADELILIDYNAYKKQESFDIKTLDNIVKNLSTPLTLGGGIKSFNDAKILFDNGADKIYLSGSVFKNIELLEEIATKYGSQSIVVGLNLIKKNNFYRILENNKDALQTLSELSKNTNIGEIKITFVDNEGMGNGMDIDFIKKILKVSDKEIIFEGGIGSIHDIVNFLNTSAKNLALGKILFFSENNLIKIKQSLINNKFNIRSS